MSVRRAIINGADGQAVLMHGGTIEARAASGGGADFHFTLPLPAEGSTPP